MKILDAEPGEVVYDFLLRAIQYCKDNNDSTVKIRHNDTVIMVYQQSHISDLCDKFDLRRALDNKMQGYTR